MPSKVLLLARLFSAFWVQETLSSWREGATLGLEADVGIGTPCILSKASSHVSNQPEQVNRSSDIRKP